MAMTSTAAWPGTGSASFSCFMTESEITKVTKKVSFFPSFALAVNLDNTSFDPEPARDILGTPQLAPKI